MKLGQRRLGESSGKHRIGYNGEGAEARGRKPDQHVAYDGDMSGAALSFKPPSSSSEAESYRGQSDGEILARLEY